MIVITIITILMMLSLNIATVLADNEPNNDDSEAELIGEGTFSGNLSSNDTEDWYEVNVPACEAILVVFHSSPGFNVTLRIDDYYTYTVEEGTSVDGQEAWLFYDGEDSDTYTVYLHFLGNGSYNFSVEYRTGRKCNTVVYDGYETTENIHVSEEDRWFEMPAEDGNQINITIEANNEITAKLEESGWWTTVGNGTQITLKHLMDSNYDKVYIEINAVQSGLINVTYTLKVKINTAPTPPGSLQAKNNNGVIALTWEKPINDGELPLYYEIYRRCPDDYWSSWEMLDTTRALYYNDSTVTKGERYNYTMVAVNEVGESSDSNEVSVIPMSVPDKPTLISIEDGDNEVTLHITPPVNDGGSPIIEYKIYRGESSGYEIFVGTIGGNITRVGDPNVHNGKTYYYYVSAVNSIGEGEHSNELSAQPATVPSVPRNLQAQAGDEKVFLSWDKPIDDGGSTVLYYEIYRTSGSNLQFVGKTAETKYTDDDMLINGVTYKYVVVAVNKEGESEITTENQKSCTPTAYAESANTFIMLSIIMLILAAGAILVYKKILKRGEADKKESLNHETGGEEQHYK